MLRNARKSARLPLHCPVSLTLLEGAVIDGVGLDISLGGMCLILPAALRPTQICALRFMAGDVPLLMMGQVVYADPEPFGGYRTGIGFLQVDAFAAATIGALLPA